VSSPPLREVHAGSCRVSLDMIPAKNFWLFGANFALSVPATPKTRICIIDPLLPIYLLRQFLRRHSTRRDGSPAKNPMTWCVN